MIFGSLVLFIDAEIIRKRITTFTIMGLSFALAVQSTNEAKTDKLVITIIANATFIISLLLLFLSQFILICINQECGTAIGMIAVDIGLAIIIYKDFKKQYY